MKYICRSKNESGFTLIEMAVVVVIVGIVISIMATVLPSLIQSAKIKKTRAILEKVDYAIRGKLISDQKLPYADSDNDGIANDGVYYGWLPYKDLGLSSGDDTWGFRLKYGVYEDVVSTHLCDISFPGSPDTSKLHTVDHDDASVTQQLYVIISGGESSGFEDRNLDDNAEYDDPNRMVEYSGGAVVYDDLMVAGDINTLKGIVCSGGGSGSGCDGVESVYCGNCDDGEDNDGDTLPDCEDTDCATHPKCVNPTCDIATSSTLSSGNINSDYSVTFTTSDGCIGSCEWQLISDGGFNDFYLHTYTGHLSGTLSQCPGTYTIRVGVTDSDSDNNPDPEKDFTIEVGSNLSVARTSGDASVNITWDDPNQEETFEVNGGYIGDINWTLNTGGATGFVYGDTGDTTYIKKDGETSAATYPFTLTATDSQCAANTANIVLTVEVTASGSGAPYTEGMEAEWQFDECDWDGTTGEVKDSSDTMADGESHNMDDTDSPARSTGKLCRCAAFNLGSKTDQYVTLGHDAFQNLGNFSLSMWFRIDKLSSTLQPLFSGAATGAANTMLIYLNPTATSVLTWVNNVQTGTFSIGGNVNNGVWHHLVWTRSGGAEIVYLDKNPIADSNSASNTASVSLADGGAIIGQEQDSVGGGFVVNEVFHGRVDEMKIFSKVLTEDDLKDLYSLTRSSCSGTCYSGPIAEYRMENFPWNGTAGEVEDSGTGASNGVAAAHGTGALPTQTTPSGGKVCRAGVFARVDASNGGYLDLGDPTDGDLDPYTDPWTISAWIKWDGATGENIIYNKENLYETRVSGGYVNYAWQPNWAWDGGSSLPVTADEWSYVTTVYDGSQQILYKNGDMVYSRAQTGAMGSNSSKLLIGARNSAAPRNFFGGMIDEVKIYNRALAENEIKADKDETRDCSADSVVITSTSLSNGIINSSYSYTIEAIGGTTPYGWELLSSEIPGLSIVPNTGELNGTIDKCAGDYTIIVRVTDAGSRADERSFTLTVENGTLTISPSSPKTFNCTTSDFYRDFGVSGQRMGALESWTITWLGANPGGFEVIKTGDTTARFRKSGTSTANTGYQFKLTANDSTCTDNTIDSDYYTLNISGDGADTPYYAGRQGEWWLDDESGQITDYSGNGNHGTASGGVTYGVQGKVWTALEFDGSSGYVDCGNNASLDVDTDDFTVGAWVKSPLVPDDGFFVDKGTGNLFDGYGLAIIGGKFAFVTDGGNGAGGKVTLTAAASVTGDTWYHVVGVRESGVKTLYINKISEPTQADARDLSDTSRHFLIGKPDADGGYFQGVVDEVVFYNRALSQSEINDFYNEASLVAYYKMDETEGNIYDYSGQANHGTNYGAEYGVDGQVGNALEFDGTDYVNVGSSADLRPADISISVWAKASELDTWNGIITNKQGPADGINLQMGTAQRIAALVGDGSAYNYVISTTVPVVGTWYHIVITHNSADNNNILYVDGTNEKEVVRELSYIAGDTIIGRFYRPSLPFKGAIDEVRIYNRVLSADEVTELYNRGIEEGG